MSVKSNDNKFGLVFSMSLFLKIPVFFLVIHVVVFYKSPIL